MGVSPRLCRGLPRSADWVPEELRRISSPESGEVDAREREASRLYRTARRVTLVFTCQRCNWRRMGESQTGTTARGLEVFTCMDTRLWGSVQVQPSRAQQSLVVSEACSGRRHLFYYGFDFRLVAPV